MDAMRVSHEKDVCPRVFFLAPPTATKGTWLDKARRISVLNKRMDLHFMCRMFLADLTTALSRGSNVNTAPDPVTCSEFSLPIEVTLPRVSVAVVRGFRSFMDVISCRISLMLRKP